MKVTPRVTIAQSSHNSSEASDESNDSFKDASEGTKGEKKVSSEQKADYSKLTHGISINLGNVSISNACGGTQLPRIAEEKDSPTGTKSDDYSSSKEIGAEKGDKQSTSSCNQPKDANKAAHSDRRQVGDGKALQCGKKEETIQSGVSQTSTQQAASSAASSQKNLDQKHYQTSEKFITSLLPHKTHVPEQKGPGKCNAEVHQEVKKILKRYKADSGDGGHPSAHEGGVVSGKEKKNN